MSAADLVIVQSTDLVIVQSTDHFDGSTSSHVRREEVLIQRLYKLLLLDHEVDSCGEYFQIPPRQAARLCSLNQHSID